MTRKIISSYPSIIESIGNTPILHFQKLGQHEGVEILGKAEFFNPLGSVKDRIGLAMIEDGERQGKLKKGMTIVEPTSGNTGIALAFVAAAKGYKIVLTMPETMSLERRTLLLLLGADVVLTPGPLGMKGAIAKARELASTAPENYFHPSQFDNPANPKIHEDTTAQEILKQTDGGDFDVFLSGVGTGGSLTGCARVLKKARPQIKVYAVEPTESPVISGGKPGPHKIQGIGAGFVPKNLDTQLIDGIVTISSEEALACAKRIILEEGIPAGISTGAVIAAALKLGQDPQFKGKRLLAILPSYTERYLSTLLAEEARTRAHALTVSTVTPEQIALL